jgi:hypothetical protein
VTHPEITKEKAKKFKKQGKRSYLGKRQVNRRSTCDYDENQEEGKKRKKEEKKAQRIGEGAEKVTYSEKSRWKTRGS